MFLYSLQRTGDLFGDHLLSLPSDPQWNNYARAWTDGQILRYGWNSLIVVTAATAISTTLAFCMGYAVARMRWRLKRLAFAAIVLGMVVPIHATLLPNFLGYGYSGLIDTRLGLIIPYQYLPGQRRASHPAVLDHPVRGPVQLRLRGAVRLHGDRRRAGARALSLVQQAHHGRRDRRLGQGLIGRSARESMPR